MAVALEGQGRGASRATSYAALLEALLRAAELHATAWARAKAFLTAAQPLCAAMKLQCLPYLSRLCPLLLEWLRPPASPDVRQEAAICLRVVVEATWPRIPAHAPLLLRHLLQARQEERARRQSTAALDAVAAALVAICGPELLAAVEGQEGGGELAAALGSGGCGVPS
mmetsp:Transcript_12823/g.32343  ORF Transcript_12823/g.32343 Transcript_12823/m.32343 type:complete len:169 (-) Transcript_12823:200-706(-)